MKKLFIYYSLTGNGEVVSNLLEKQGYILRRVIEKKKMPKKFFFRVLIGGFRAGINQRGKLINYDNDVSNFEEIVIGSPLWNGKFPPAINSVLDKTNLENKILTFLIYSGSGEAPKIPIILEKRGIKADLIILKEPKTHLEELDKIAKL